MLLLKHLLFLLFEIMQIIAHTPQGIFKGLQQPYDEKQYRRLGELLSLIDTAKRYCLETDHGEFYMNKSMIDQSIFVLVK
jgi:hypothetical protein